MPGAYQEAWAGRKRLSGPLGEVSARLLIYTLIGLATTIGTYTWSAAKVGLSVYNAYSRAKYTLANVQELAIVFAAVSDALEDDDDDGEVIRLITDYVQGKISEAITGLAVSVAVTAVVGVGGKAIGVAAAKFGKSALTPNGIANARALYKGGVKPHANQPLNIVTSSGRNISIMRDRHGWPILGPHAVKTVNIRPLSGKYLDDFAAADRKAGITKAWRENHKPRLLWHHNQQFGKMELVPAEIHVKVPHVGATGMFKKMYREHHYDYAAELGLK